ncbi:hypothetical protein EUGRSUZ_G02885 [Eucalyptus grandis]|uniref:Uncharacterized protein n=2 Tax=Eucalyptus grandis TaxID=71139 RepID=A0ACC3K7G7_EUCGR|nr:hypothetical protein EUGRSUZ_G02885 [Eucalyptus grandis]
MVIKSLQVTGMSAKDLHNVHLTHKMHPYVTVSLSGNHKKSTDVHKDGGTSPSWVDLLTFPVDEACTDLLTLVFEIMSKKSRGGEKEVGRVKVPIAELLEKQGDGRAKQMSCSVSLPSGVGKTQGVLEFTYKFSEELPGGCENTPAPERAPPTGSRGRGLVSALTNGLTNGVTEGMTSAFVGEVLPEDAADPSEDAADPSEDAADPSEDAADPSEDAADGSQAAEK